MPKFILILMVKNEEKILQRCMSAVEGLVDAYVITDTGSTDKTVEQRLESAPVPLLVRNRDME
jgi:glycosyltransferase involved in cell wall biosynthesis